MSIYHAFGSTANPIRFLDLLPSKHDGVICCELAEDDLSNAEPYHALSYTWGPEESTQSIQLDGYTTSIRENLFDFLKVMIDLHPDGFRRLWIDALCIDQRNVEERNQQVMQMGQVFSGAATTFIWLGSASDESSSAFDNFERVEQEFKVSGRPSLIADCLSALHIDEKFTNSINLLLRREYWSRVWIIQELFLTTHGLVMCGSRSMALKDLEEYCHNRSGGKYLEPVLMTTPGFRICVRSRRYRLDGTSRDNETPYASSGIWAMAGWLKDQQCSDVRDRMYGVLGVVVDVKEFEVDYLLERAALFFRAIRHFPMLNSIHATNDAREMLGLRMSELTGYLLTEGGLKEDTIWISVFMHSFSDYSCSLGNTIYDSRSEDTRPELLPDDIVIEFDHRFWLSKDVLVFRKEPEGYVYLAYIQVVSVVRRTRETTGSRDLRIIPSKSSFFESIRFRDIRLPARNHEHKVEIPIQPDVLLHLMRIHAGFRKPLPDTSMDFPLN